VGWFLFIFGSGWAFFLGVAMIYVAMLLRRRTNSPWSLVVGNQCARLGLLFTLISAAPLPYWLYAVAFVSTVGWMVTENAKAESWKRYNGRWGATTLVIWMLMVAWELPFQVSPRAPPLDPPSLYILADSITAGLEEHENTWPKRLAKKHSLEIHDLSRAGATAGSAIRQAEKIPSDAKLVLVEIGGNDLLGSTTLQEFDRDLDALLQAVATPERTVLMFELPLPPFCNEYGRIQRRLAARYQVRLIPKRILMAILTGHAATTDTIHLDTAGHEKMAETVWQIIAPAAYR
jgi:acyl-CoA thioesterase-1